MSFVPRPSDLRLLSTSESVLRVTEQNHNPPSVDAHTHIFCCVYHTQNFCCVFRTHIFR